MRAMSERLHKRILQKRILFLFLIMVTMTSVCAEASVYSSYKAKVKALAKGIRTEINLGGSSLPKGSPSLKKADKKQWAQARKWILSGKYNGYAYQFTRSFSTETAALGFTDMIVGQQYRYLELESSVEMNKKGRYLPLIDLGTQNRKSLSLYIKNEKKMYEKLRRMYRKEIYPYRNMDTATKLAIAITVVDNYLSYDRTYVGNLARALQRKKGLCADYAFMLDFFLKEIGFKTKLLSIYEQFNYFSEPGYHAVNAVRIGGKWFFIDPTNMDQKKYAVIKNRDNIWFNASLDWLTFPGWKLRNIH